MEQAMEEVMDAATVVEMATVAEGELVAGVAAMAAMSAMAARAERRRRRSVSP
jgi:hypothetical protein